jgi:micrococcal nuclease
VVNQRSVRVEILDIDRYRRMVAILWLAERNVNEEMIATGTAEAYVEYLKKSYRAPFIQAEQEAKAQGRGVWSQGEPL